MKNPIPLLRRIALIEGISFLLLLGVAMPLKYFYGMPEAVRVIGMAHGVLFLLLCFLLSQALMRVSNWTFGRSAAVFVGSLLPFGPFLLDGRMKQWQAEAVLEADDEGAAA